MWLRLLILYYIDLEVLKRRRVLFNLVIFFCLFIMWLIVGLVSRLFLLLKVCINLKFLWLIFSVKYFSFVFGIFVCIILLMCSLKVFLGVK